MPAYSSCRQEAVGASPPAHARSPRYWSVACGSLTPVDQARQSPRLRCLAPRSPPTTPSPAKQLANNLINTCNPVAGGIEVSAPLHALQGAVSARQTPPDRCPARWPSNLAYALTSLFMRTMPVRPIEVSAYVAGVYAHARGVTHGNASPRNTADQRKRCDAAAEKSQVLLRDWCDGARYWVSRIKLLQAADGFCMPAPLLYATPADRPLRHPATGTKIQPIELSLSREAT
jgi:hypothetical protein